MTSLPLQKKWLVLLQGIGIAMLIGLWTTHQALDVSNNYFTISLLINLIVFIVVIRDILKNKLISTHWWLLPLLLTGPLGIFIYLIIRERLLDLPNT